MKYSHKGCRFECSDLLTAARLTVVKYWQSKRGFSGDEWGYTMCKTLYEWQNSSIYKAVQKTYDRAFFFPIRLLSFLEWRIIFAVFFSFFSFFCFFFCLNVRSGLFS